MTESVDFFKAFLAGFISFISPCVLPLVPVYLTTMTGLSIDELGKKEGRPLLHIFFSSLAFCAGFSAIFIAMGLTATALGSFLEEHRRVLEIVGGVLVIIFGIHMTGLVKISMLYRTLQLGKKAGETKEKEERNKLIVYVNTFLMGGAFALGWSPCIGPILAAVLILAATKESAAQGGILLGVYSLGLAIPFILSGLAFGSFTSHYARFRKHLGVVEKVSGVLLILFGLLIATHNFTWLAGWFYQIMPDWFNNIVAPKL